MLPKLKEGTLVLLLLVVPMLTTSCHYVWTGPFLYNAANSIAFKIWIIIWVINIIGVYIGIYLSWDALKRTFSRCLGEKKTVNKE